MKGKEIQEIEKYFLKYSSRDYHDMCSNEPLRCSRYLHKWEEFQIIVFEDGEVYQSGSDHEVEGIELKTFDDLKTRFKSFTGENVEKIDDEQPLESSNQKEWEKEINVKSKVVQTSKSHVVCECLIDEENKTFELRSFPRHLFDQIKNIESNPFIILSIKSKENAIRIDVLSGDGLVDKKLFDLSDDWKNLDDEGFNDPINEPIKL